MTFTPEKLAALRARFGGANEAVIHDPHFRAVAANVIDESGTRSAPYAGMPTLLDAPARQIDWDRPDFGDLQVALLGVPMDLGASNRSGCRFGPRALRAIERVGPYNHALRCAPVRELRVADIGDVPMRSRYSLEQSHEDIHAAYARIAAAGVTPLSVGGDHSVTLPILRALGARRPVALVHFDSHTDSYHHLPHWLGNRRSAAHWSSYTATEGNVDPTRSSQIGIRPNVGTPGSRNTSEELGYRIIGMDEIERDGWEKVASQVRARVGDAPVYVSFDIDCLDPAFAPGTGTPEVGGVTVREAQAMLRGLAGLDIVGGDLVEVAPSYDATANTAHAGAQILFEILSLMRLRGAR